MELLYIAFANASLKGVCLKIESTVAALNKIGLKAKSLIISPTGIESIRQKHIEVLQANESKNETYKKISEYIKSNYTEPPIILFRYPLSDEHLLKFVKKFQGQIIFEHNTIEEQELKLYFKYYSFRDFLYNLRHFNFSDLIQNYLILKNEIKYGAEVLSYAKGGISVTSEIAKYEDKRAKRDYNQAVIGNPIFTNNTGVIKESYRIIDTNLQCVFIAGHANNWHGIDRVISGVKDYNGRVRIKVTIIGSVIPRIRAKVSSFGLSDSIKFVGSCDRNEMERHLMDSDLGISTLALHRIPLSQGSVLKTREYLTYGLPVLLGYEDEEVESIDSLKDVLIKVSPNDTPLEFNSIIEKLNILSKKNMSPSQISEIAYCSFGVESKAQQIKEVCKVFKTDTIQKDKL